MLLNPPLCGFSDSDSDTLVGLPTGAVVGMQIMQSGFAISDGGSHCMFDTLLHAEFGKDTASVSWVGGVGHETVELCLMGRRCGP